MSVNDSLNRVKNKQELFLTKWINANNSTHKIKDVYRSMEAEGGYTWNRKKCYWRLDSIFVSGNLASKTTKVQV
jgi:hypothetical protein